MASTSSRSARYARWLAVPLGFVISAVLVWQASYAAFTDTTENAGNSWTAGSVTITDDDQDAALFTAADLVPGSTGSQEITVTYEGTLDAAVKVYGADFAVLAPTGGGQSLEQVSATGNTLADNIVITIEGNEGDELGAGPTGTLYTGTLAGFASTHGEANTPMRYDVAGDSNMKGTFRFTYRVKDDAPPSVQGQQVRLSFVAEATSTR
ncbi:CalY family protein [Georgenia satyanarayanai]|uniref:CalY family protein n=1 Tax=Georgenia satyanarayanai TaxID=860221 RepID=UPI0020404F64|nr:CalY family protein [Georgenia satyanarayanai]MCM3661191.1 CalY family protein [Georgenia satyanarayanai]